VLGNQDRRFFILQFGENFRGPAFQRGDKFRARGSDTKAILLAENQFAIFDSVGESAPPILGRRGRSRWL
jgi:hypothetical protein